MTTVRLVKHTSETFGPVRQLRLTYDAVLYLQAIHTFWFGLKFISLNICISLQSSDVFCERT